MITKPLGISLLLAAYLLVAGSFVFFALRIQAVQSFLDSVVANQQIIIEHTHRHDRSMNRQDAINAEILKRLCAEPCLKKP